MIQRKKFVILKIDHILLRSQQWRSGSFINNSTISQHLLASIAHFHSLLLYLPQFLCVLRPWRQENSQKKAFQSLLREPEVVCQRRKVEDHPEWWHLLPAEGRLVCVYEKLGIFLSLFRWWKWMEIGDKLAKSKRHQATELNTKVVDGN